MKKEKKYMEKEKLNHFVTKYSNMDCKGFGSALENLLEENHISKTDLSKIIDIDNQCLTNWTSPSVSKPKWLNVMYRMNLFFYDYDKNFDSLCLYDKNYRKNILNQKKQLEAQQQELDNQKIQYEKKLHEIDYKHSLLTKIKNLEVSYNINIEQMVDDLTALMQYKKVSCTEQKDKQIEKYNRTKYNNYVNDFVRKHINKF